MQIKKITRIGVMILLALAAVCWVSIIATDDDNGGLISPFIYLAYLTVIIAAGLSIYYSIVALAKSKNAKKVLINFTVFIGIFIVGLIVGKGEEVIKDGEVVATAFGSRMVSAGLFMFYVLAAGAILLMIYTSFARIKK